MTTTRPNIQPTDLMNAADACRALGICRNSFKKYVGILGLQPHMRKIGGVVWSGRDIMKIWIYGI